MRQTRVMHIITRFIRGGAQENTLLTVQGLAHMPEYQVSLITGPGIGPEGDMMADAHKSGAEIIVIDELRREINARRDWLSYWALRRWMRKLKPHIVHTHSSKAGILGRWAAKAEKVPLIVHTVHGLPFHEHESYLFNQLYRALEKNCAKRTDLIISVADAMTEKAVAAGIAPKEKFCTIYSGLDAKAFITPGGEPAGERTSLGISTGAKVIGVIARISPLKGHEFIIKAAPKIIAKHPDAKFLFVGDGHIRKEMEVLAAQNHVLDRIIWAGLRPYREIPGLLTAMDVVVHTSLREGLARVLPQALLAGVPVVSYDVDGAREVVISGRTGWLVPPKSIDALADAVCDALADPARAKALALEGRNLCGRLFPAEVMVGQIHNQYRRLIAERKIEL